MPLEPGLAAGFIDDKIRGGDLGLAAQIVDVELSFRLEADRGLPAFDGGAAQGRFRLFHQQCRENQVLAIEGERLEHLELESPLIELPLPQLRACA